MISVHSKESWQSEILGQLDAAAEEFSFPGPPNVHYEYAAMRLTGYRSEGEWLLAFEEICYSNQEGLFLNVIYCFGERVSKPGWCKSYEVLTADRARLLDDEFGLLVDLERPLDVVVNGKARRFAFTVDDYGHANLAPDDIVTPIAFLRLLVGIDRDAFFLGGDQLLTECGCEGNRPSTFVVLNGWDHPDLTEGELPSGKKCFSTLAMAMASGNKGLLECPTSTRNTDWWHWDELTD